MGSERGQATVDYVAIIAVLAIVFTAALASAAIGAPGIVNAVSGQFRHALCLIGGGPCPNWRSRPCTVATSRETRHVAVTVVLLRYDDDRYVLREEMSDGTVQLTVATTRGAGWEVGFGGGAHATVDGRDVGAGGEARIAGQLMLGSGKVFVARDGQQADAFMKTIESGGSPSKPSQDFHEGGARALGQGSIGAGPTVALRGAANMMLGYKRDLRSGALTLTLNAGRNGWGAITAGLGPAIGNDGTATFNLTLDRHHRPTELSIQATGSASGGAYLPLYVTHALRTAGGFSSALLGRRWELGARLDLRDPVVADAWAQFRDNPASGDAIGAMGAAIRDHAYLDVRTYRTKSTSGGGSAGISEGVRLGGEYEHTDDRSELLAAASRPPAGLWEPRIDCESV